MLFPPLTMLVRDVFFLLYAANVVVMLARSAVFVFYWFETLSIFASFGVIVSSCNFFISASRAETLVVLLSILLDLCPFSMKRTIVKIRNVARVARIPINGQFLGALAFLALAPPVTSVGLLEPSKGAVALFFSYA